MDDRNDENDGRQAHMRFDDSPQRFRDANPGQAFPGASGVLFEQAMAQTRMAVSLADPALPEMPLVFVNRAFIQLTGYSEEEALGRNCRFLQGPDTDPETVRAVSRALAREDVIVVELLNYRADGTPFWNALHLGPIYDETGKLIYYFGSQWDVSDVHTARADEKHARMMARELSHRMKNMFAVIAGLVTVTGRTRGIRAEAEEINERIRALGRAFETTLEEPTRGTVEMRPTVEAVLKPYDPAGDRITVEGENRRIDPALVSTIGLALHELATNAIKYGALSTDRGTVTLGWTSDAAGALNVVWHEAGGPPVNPPNSIGSGMNIIETLLTTIGGTLSQDWAPEGLTARIVIPNETG